EYSRTTMQAAVATRQLIEARGLPCPIVSGTGTSTFAAVLGLAGLTELQIGTYALMDWTFQERTGNLFEIALTVLATVINATPDQFVLDVGMKGVSNRNGPARLPELTGYEVVPGFSEEHTLVRLPGHKVRVGDRLQLQPGHANGTINLYRQVVVHDGGTVRHIWPISATGYVLPG
ncbi:MAG: DSD1 family PLP-dependent enzyme, partial [Verrucomicrobiota bacterium]